MKETATEQQVRVFLNVHRNTPVSDLIPLAEKVALNRKWHGAVRKKFLAAIEREVTKRMAASMAKLRQQFGK